MDTKSLFKTHNLSNTIMICRLCGSNNENVIYAMANHLHVKHSLWVSAQTMASARLINYKQRVLR